MIKVIDVIPGLRPCDKCGVDIGLNGVVLDVNGKRMIVGPTCASRMLTGKHGLKLKTIRDMAKRVVIAE